MTTKRVFHFKYMGAYWSLPVEVFNSVSARMERGEKEFDLYWLGAKELKAKPKGYVPQLKGRDR
jgi:hypothetical protein